MIESAAIALDGTIYVGSYDKCLFAINPDGTEKWRFMTGDHIESSPAIGSDGIIYIGAGDGYLYAIYSDSYGLARSSWPKFRHDERNTGCICYSPVPLSRGTTVLLLIFISISFGICFKKD